MSSRYRYEELASFITGLVCKGTLEPGADTEIFQPRLLSSRLSLLRSLAASASLARFAHDA